MCCGLYETNLKCTSSLHGKDLNTVNVFSHAKLWDHCNIPDESSTIRVKVTIFNSTKLIFDRFRFKITYIKIISY